ncbi:hypothetical protein T231_05155 [Tannerella sp. oral taxon BU063 isolate Cell 6/7/9]|uniref:Uncharacterized protein n=1 Tax=Tannerella sp. oral taxon BU063 isolate Cell 6/7/9 TaxID=1411021 RepID=W2CV60_9BACT|nr:hypothetical protein T231_05155 [Tannerella sp. oral taxon BU063 isolate Cell 6/7/9]
MQRKHGVRRAARHSFLFVAAKDGKAPLRGNHYM